MNPAPSMYSNGFKNSLNKARVLNEKEGAG